MRVAEVLPVYGRDGFSFLGGGERYVYHLAQAMSRQCDITLVTFGPRPRTGSIPGLRHLILPAVHRSEINPIPLVPLPLGKHFDLVHAYQLHTIVTSMLALWCRASGLPLIVTDFAGGGRSPIRKWKLQRLIPKGISISDHSRRELPAELRARTVVVKGGVDLGWFQYTSETRAPQVVQVGRIMPHKGFNYLIEAADNDLEVVIAGKVVDRRYFDLLKAKSKGRRVRFVIDPTDDQIRELYRRSAVTVAGSVYYDIYGTHYPKSELLGLTLLESMAVGTPVVCTAVGGMPEYVDEGNTGFIVPPGDVGQMRRRIKQLIDDPALATRMGRAGHEAVQKYSWERVAAEVMTEYRALTGTHASSN
jgi:glycosyltransferase involved in cell wall biosynthesis